MNTVTQATTIEQLIEGKKASDFCFYNGSRMVSATRMGGFSSRTGEWSEGSRADANGDEIELANACDERDRKQLEVLNKELKAQKALEAQKLIADIAAIENKKLNKIAKKYHFTEHNDDNYSIGGGLSSQKFASRRHEDAREDAGKMTLGEATSAFKKATGMDTDIVREVLEYAVPCMEWHHAGQLPKSYGGGMKKTYFLNAKEIVKCAVNWESYCEMLATHKAEVAEKEAKIKVLEQSKRDFLTKHATRYTRLLTGNEPEHSVRCESEYNGKFGWFSSSKGQYNMHEYHSGWAFATAELRNEYFNIV